MKKLALGLVAAGALVAATAVPALAQVGIYAGPGGFSVELGAPGYYYGGPAPYYSGGYYDYAPGWDDGYRVYGQPGWHGYHFHGHHD
jgi:hypothetical protein